MSSNALLWPSQGTKPEERLDKYKYLRLPPQGVGGIDLPDLPLLAIYPPLADNTYQFYKFYQIKKGQVPTTQTNMPLVIIDTLGAGILQEASGFDIRVFDSAGLALDYEVQSVNTSTGDIVVWVNMATIKDLEFIQLTFGKPSAIDGSTPNAVYDSSYTSVYHLNGVGTDSTSNVENMTIFGTTTVPGKIGNAIDFAGTVNDFLIRNPYTPFPTTAITVEFWIKTTDNTFGTVSYASLGDLSDLFIFQTAATDITVAIIGNFPSIVNPPNIKDGNFHQITMTWKSSDGEVLFYIDGVLIMTLIGESTGLSFTNNGALVLAQEQDTIGGGFNADQALDGILDEVKISNIVRDANYVTTTFNNQDNNNTFWFETPLLENGVENNLVDDMGRNIRAVES